MSCRNPTQVISNPKYIDMLVDMRSRYDRIFVDSPPIGAVSDSLNLMPYVDGVIYVVRYNGVSTRNAGECILRLREVGVPIIGAVLNRMSLRLASIYTDSFDASYEKYYEAAKVAATQTAQASEVAEKSEDKSDDTTKVS